MAQSLERILTSYIKEHRQLLEHMTSPDITVKAVQLLGFQNAVITYRSQHAELVETDFNSPVIASMVTAYGRCFLYREGLSRYPKDCYYCDTGDVLN